MTSAHFLGPLYRSYTVVHFNIYSTKKYWDDVLILLNWYESLVGVIVPTTINIHEHDTLRFYFLCYAGYFHARLECRGGEIAIFAKTLWLACCFTFSVCDTECISINVSNSSCSHHLLAVYRPPSENVNLFIQDIHTLLFDLFADSQL